jgi:4-hydroxy-tetrahydrodipicolinate reductase
MNIALIGYGKMGKEIEQAALRRRITIRKIFPTDRELIAINKKSLQGVDVCIDFTSPLATLDIAGRVAECGRNLVIGTTGWYDQLDQVAAIAKKKKIGILYSPNFSIGMNLFYQITAAAASALSTIDEYDVAVHEIHHSGKKDSPSGTALTIGRILLDHLRKKKDLFTETSHDTLPSSRLHVTSERVGHVVGTHAVLFDSEADSIELIHRAKNRSGFALGALIAAEWLAGRKGFFTMNDVLESL